MIDYKKLRGEFTEKLSEFDKEMLLNWIDFDRNREVVSKLLNGERVSIQSETIIPHRLTDKRENIDSNDVDSSYAMAA